MGCWADPAAFLKGFLPEPGPQDITFNTVGPWKLGARAGEGGKAFREIQVIVLPAPVPLHVQGPCPEVPFFISVFRECLPMAEISVHIAPL